ncbi:hypothetical protein HII31_05464, partial [Pseudocercospora fuligena]
METPMHEPPYMVEVRKRVQAANPEARGWELGKVIYEELRKLVWADAMANQQIAAAPVNVEQNDRRPPPTKQALSDSNTTPNEVIVIEDSPAEAHAAPALATQFPPSAPKNSQDLAVQSQLALEEQHRQQQAKAASRPPSQTTQRASQALQRPLPAARTATPKNAAATARHVAATTPHAPRKVMKNVAQNIAHPQSRSSAPAVGAASARAYRGQARGVPQALQGSQSIDPKRFEQMRQMYAQQQPRSAQAQTCINPQDLLRAPQQQSTPQVPRHNIDPSVALQKIEASRQSHVVGEQQTPVRKRSAAEIEQQTPPKRHKTSSTGWQTPVMQQQIPVPQEQMMARQQAMMQRQMQQQAMLRRMQTAQQTPTMQQHQTPAMPPQVSNGQQRILTAQEREAYRQMMIRRNSSQQQQTPTMQQHQTPAMAPQ